jgi:tetratricopeptide (TPR) repeat protein
LDALNGLGLIRVDQRRFDEGFQFLSRAMAIIDEHGWQQTRYAASTLNNIGGLRWIEGKRAAACAILEKAIALLGGAKTPKHPDFEVTLAIMENLGVHYTSEGRFEEAERWLTQALRQIHPYVSKYPRSWASLLNQWVRFCAATDRRAEALQTLQYAAVRWEQVGDVTRAEFAEVLFNLASLHRERNELDEAERHLRRALTILEKHPDGREKTVADTCAALGLLFLARKDAAAAEGFFQRQLSALEKSPNPPRCDLVIAVNNVGVAQRERGCLTDAEATLAHAVELARAAIRDEPTLPVHEMNLANVLKNFAQHRQKQGRISDAVTLAREAQEIAGRATFAAIPKAREILRFAEELLGAERLQERGG